MRLITASNQIATTYQTAESLYNPKSVSGLILWLDANTLNTLSQDAAIDTWYDRSGYGHDAVQSNASYKPTLKKNLLNDLSFVRALYSSTQYMTITRTATLEPNTITIFSAYIHLQGNASNYILSKPYANSGWTTPYANYGIAASYSDNLGRTNFHVSLSGPVLKQVRGTNYFYGDFYDMRIVCYIYDGTTTMYGWVNSKTIALTYASGGANSGNIYYPNATNLSLFSQSPYTIGQSPNLCLGDLLVYNSALSNDDRTKVTNYLMKKYCIPLTP